MNKIYTKEKNLVIEIPLIANRSNPWDEKYNEEMNNIVAVIEPDKYSNIPKMGFCYNIDMDYKDKPDQHTDFFYLYNGEEYDFKKLCKELKIELIEYKACCECRGALFGCYTMNDKGFCHEECKELKK